ncbi:NADPH-dependent oxidoreductase [bacterium]|nr:MAG: NADPH-dependent oxidoreductase [bacterium]
MSSDAWKARYGVEPPADLPDLGTFLDHRSIRHYADREVPESLVTALIAAAQSASTSSNLQLWSVVTVQDPERRAQMAQLCGDQDHVHKAPWFFAFLADHHRLRHAASKAGEAAEGLGYMEFLLMATIDAALAAERMVCAAEALGLGVCYIGALRNDPGGVRDLLELPNGVFGLFGLCLGYPEKDAEIKPRLSQPAVWFRERYDPEPDNNEYDERMQAFYEGQNMRGNRTWSARSGRRVDRHHLTGREVLRPWLESIGMGIE